MEVNIEHWKASAECERIFEWRKWTQDIPPIEFPAGWRVRIVPPFASAVVRFRVQLPDAGLVGHGEVSVYLDCYDHLGYFGEPYWEVYPYQGDVGRCAMNDIPELLKMIADRSPSGK